MGKILYIEDIPKIATIKLYFRPILTAEQLTCLNDYEKSERGATTDKIRGAINQSDSCLEIQSTFPKALQTIVSNYADYDLIILDRNLKDGFDYGDQMDKLVQALEGMGLDKAELERCERFEGDLLLTVLIRICGKSNNYSMLDKVYYLTAYAADELKTDMQSYIKADLFKTTHIVGKDAGKDNPITRIVRSFPKYIIESKYHVQCGIIRKYFTENDVENLIGLIDHTEKIEDAYYFLKGIRPFMEKMLIKLAKRIDDVKADYWYVLNGKTLLDISAFRKSLRNGSNNVPYNELVENSIHSLWKVGSVYGDHPGNQEDVSLYSIRALLNQLCDVILWYDKAMDAIEKK